MRPLALLALAGSFLCVPAMALAQGPLPDDPGPIAGETVPPDDAPAAQTHILGARVGLLPDATQVVLDVSAPAEANVLLLADPYRLAIDLPRVSWSLSPGGEVELGAVDRYRAGLMTEERFRIVLDLNRPVRVEGPELIPAVGDKPQRLVFELYDTDHDDFMAVIAAQTAVLPETGEGARAVSAADDGRPLIIIDPGHGGVDPGANRGRILEKDIVLAAALTLRDRLEASGQYRVLLTRETDVFIPLAVRAALATALSADLFISLHADAYHTTAARGASVYTLSTVASDAEARALAERENRSDILAGVGYQGGDDVVGRILFDLMMDVTARDSIGLAETMLDEFAAVTDLLENPHRYAGFAVLKTAGTPALLVELGYVSNPSDAARLNEADYRDVLVGAMVRAIDGYFAAPGEAAESEPVEPDLEDG